MSASTGVHAIIDFERFGAGDRVVGARFRGFRIARCLDIARLNVWNEFMSTCRMFRSLSACPFIGRTLFAAAVCLSSVGLIFGLTVANAHADGSGLAAVRGILA